MITLAIILPGSFGAETHWARISRGHIIGRGKGLHWQREGVDRFVLIAPASATALHRVRLAGLSRKEADAAARQFVLENNAGTAEGLHVAIGQRDAAGNIDVALIDAAGLGDWIAWAQAESFDPDAIVPAALLLPSPREGTIEAWIGDERVTRASTAHPSDPMLVMDAGAVDAALVAAAANPPLDLRQGRFAKQRTGRPMRRGMILAGLALFACLLLALFLMIGLGAR
jgi:general secretion pathway protein L